MGLIQLWNAIRQSGRERTIAGLGSLVGFFTFGGFLVGVILENLLLPALPMISTQLPFYQWAFVLLGLAAFFLLYWSILIGLPDLFSRWKRLAIMPIFHIGTFVVFVLFFTNPSNVTQISNGVDSYISMPLNVSILAFLWVMIYLGLAPLFSFYRYSRSEHIGGTPRVLWVRVLWLGILLQLFGYLLDVIQFHDPFISIVRVIIAIGWFLIVLGYTKLGRTKAI
jgi:hypothetical protein